MTPTYSTNYFTFVIKRNSFYSLLGMFFNNRLLLNIKDPIHGEKKVSMPFMLVLAYFIQKRMKCKFSGKSVLL